MNPARSRRCGTRYYRNLLSGKLRVPVSQLKEEHVG